MPITPADDSTLLDDDGVRIKFFRDAEYSAAPPIVAYQGDVPTLLQCSPQGALKVDASVTVGEVNIGDVGMYLQVGGVNHRWNGTLNPDATYAAWVQDQRMYFDGSNNLKVLSAQGGTWNLNNISGTISLPTGASTSAKQDTGNTSLASIDSKTPALGQALAASSVPVVLTASQLSTLTPLSTVTVIQPTAANLNANVTGTISANQAGTWNINNISGVISLPTGAATAARQDTGNSSLASIDGKTPALGQAPAAGSVPVVLTASQLSTITPLSTVNVTQSTAANLNSTAYQGGTWTVQPGNTQNTTPWLVNVSAALPTGLNVIGSVTQSGGPWTQNVTQFGSSNVVTGTGASGSGIPRVTVSSDSNILATQSGTWTVQPGNIQNTTPWLTQDSADGSVAPGTVATKSQLGGGVYNSAGVTVTDGQQAALQLDNRGRLIVSSVSSNPSAPISASATESLNKRAYQAVYTFTINASITEYPVIYMRNPVGSGKVIYVRLISSGSNAGTGKTSIRVYSNPTVTANGTAITASSMYIGGGASAASSLLTSVPTVTSNGTVISQVSGANEQARIDYDWGLLLSAGNSLLITISSIKDYVVDTNIIWTEV